MKRLGLVVVFCSCLTLFFFFLANQSLAKSIRTVVGDDGQVVGINTAIGYSTILEFSSKPISAVLGDQDSFKLEYVGNSITIKPLISRARSNLFVFTEYERFNCQIVTVAPAQVDYIVRIRTKEKSYPVERATQDDSATPVPEPSQSLKVIPVQKSSSFDGFTLSVISVSRTRVSTNPRAVTLVDFELSSKKKSYPFQPSSIGARQLGVYLNLESIYLDRLDLSPESSPIRGKIAILAQDFKATSPLVIVFAVPGQAKKRSIHRIEVSTAKTNGNGKLNEKGK